MNSPKDFSTEELLAEVNRRHGTDFMVEPELKVEVAHIDREFCTLALDDVYELVADSTLTFTMGLDPGLVTGEDIIKIADEFKNDMLSFFHRWKLEVGTLLITKNDGETWKTHDGENVFYAEQDVERFFK